MTIHTFGYLGQSPDALATWLKVHDAILVDIRESPVSRVPGWSGANLQENLRKRWLWCPYLGNLNYRGGPIKIASLPDGISCVEAQQRPVVLMCACRDYQMCHRRVVAEALRERGHTLEELKL